MSGLAVSDRQVTGRVSVAMGVTSSRKPEIRVQRPQVKGNRKTAPVGLIQ
jgi:hypothetical protein